MLWHFSDELLSSITVLLTCFYHVDRQAFNKTIVRADPNFVVKDYFFFFLSDNDFFFFKLFIPCPPITIATTVSFYK